MSCAGSRPVGNLSVPEPAKPVDLSSYLGRWYEIARYDSSFERDCEGVTAEYSLRPDGMIRVLNICHKGGPEGRVGTAEAKAKIIPGSGNAKLKVSYFGPFFLRRLLDPRPRRELLLVDRRRTDREVALAPLPRSDAS